MSMEYTLGFDFGTGSVRVCILNVYDGQMITVPVSDFQGGVEGTFVDENDPLVARQSLLSISPALRKL